MNGRLLVVVGSLAVALSSCSRIGATVASASLASDCAAAEKRSSLVDCGSESCGFCQQTSMQLELTAGPGRIPSKLEVLSVKLIDLATGLVVDTLTAREPQQWSTASGSYVPWNESLAPGSSLKASYNLSAPDWVRIGNGQPWSTHSMKFILEVVLSDGSSSMTVRSAELIREPEIVT